MLLKIKIIALSIFLYFGAVVEASNWYEQKLEGWYYFDEKNGEDNPEASTPSIEDAQEILELEKVKLQKLLSLALLVPSSENVEKYIEEQRRWVNQSSQFADAWGKILLEKPFLGDFLANPTTNYGLIAKREVDLGKRKTLLQKLSETHFLLFFFRGKDPLSEKAAEVTNLFASLNNWKVKATSLDGFGIKNITDFQVDKGLGEKLGVQESPSFFVIDPFENQAFPVGAGLISVTDLEQNIELQLKDAAVNE